MVHSCLLNFKGDLSKIISLLSGKDYGVFFFFFLDK